MTTRLSGIDAVIFDLGGVIVDLAVHKTILAFSDASGLPPEQIQQAYLKYPEFFAYERGELNDVEFRSMIRRIFSLQTDDREIDRCWNAMLVGVPEKKINLLNQIKNTFQVFALSNTNNIHIQYVNQVLLPDKPLDTLFHQVYYSHEAGMRKPEPGFYKYVLTENKLSPSGTLFLDDNLENIQAAQALGMQVKHIEHPDQLIPIFEQ